MARRTPAAMRPRTAKKICLPARSPRGVPVVVETTIAMPIAVRASARARMRRSIRRGRISASRDIAQFTRALAGAIGGAGGAHRARGARREQLGRPAAALCDPVLREARRERSGGRRSMLAVLHEDDGDDFRVVPRREAREPAVVSQLLGKEGALLRFLLSPDPNGTGLPPQGSGS